MDVDADPQHSSTPSLPQPHDILWFPDGNVVLATDTYLFKVYKAFLSLHSSVFRDMFDFPADGGDESLPLVKLVGDKGEDVAHLLLAIFKRHYYHRDDKNTSLDVITALLILTTKYDFADLRKDVILQISNQYPMSMQESDLADGEDPELFGRHRSDCHIRLLKAAFVSDVNALLPILFFSSTNNTTDFILDNIEPMGPDFLRVLIIGREQQDVKVAQLIADLPQDLRKGVDFEGFAGCERGATVRCFEVARFEYLSILAGTTFSDTRGESIVKLYLKGVCRTCRPIVVKSIEDKRQLIWEEIPSLFKCMGWDAAQAEIKKMTES